MKAKQMKKHGTSRKVNIKKKICDNKAKAIEINVIKQEN
jgi:hypothetical protein